MGPLDGRRRRRALLDPLRVRSTCSIAVLDDIHHAWDGTEGVRRLRERAEVQMFTAPFGDPAALRGFEALVANRERTAFTRDLLEPAARRPHHRPDR